MLVSFECTVVGQRLRNLSDVRSLQAPKQVRRPGAGVSAPDPLPTLECWHQNCSVHAARGWHGYTLYRMMHLLSWALRGCRHPAPTP